MNLCISGVTEKWSMLVILAALVGCGTTMAGEAGVIRAIRMDPEMLAGLNLEAEARFVAPEDVLDGAHQPRGAVLHYGEQLIVEVYEDEAATFRFSEPFLFDEFILVLDGKLILTGPDGVSQAYLAGDSLVVPKGFSGEWKMLGNYRELVVIERQAYEAAFDTQAE